MKLNSIYVIVLLIFIPVIGNTTNGYFAHGTGIKTRALAGAGTAGIDFSQLFFNFSYSHKFNEDLAIGISPIIAIQSIRTNGLEDY